MRSALTDAPVVQPALSVANVFTTLPLRATQHTTGLMVKVAPLLPSRDLLSSPRQLRWTHTLVFAKGGTGRWSNRQKSLSALVSAGRFQFSFCLLTCSLFFQFGFGSGQDQQQIPYPLTMQNVVGKQDRLHN